MIRGDALKRPEPQPVYEVRCTARGCEWSVQTNVSGRLNQYWRWHLAYHRENMA